MKTRAHTRKTKKETIDRSRDDEDDAFVVAFEERERERKREKEKTKETHRDGQSFLFSLSSSVARLEFDRRFVQRVSAYRARIERRRPRPDGNRVPLFHLDFSLRVLLSLLLLLSSSRRGVHGSGGGGVHGCVRRQSTKYRWDDIASKVCKEKERSKHEILGFHIFFRKKKQKEKKQEGFLLLLSHDQNVFYEMKSFLVLLFLVIPNTTLNRKIYSKNFCSVRKKGARISRRRRVQTFRTTSKNSSDK